MDKQCLVCQKTFHAERATAKFCSATCRKAYSRDVQDETSVKPTVTTKSDVQGYHKDHFHIYKGKNKYNVGKRLCNKCELEIDVENEWSHSACYKTQEEIEAHYNLKNFPRIKYGSGAGAYSPYPKSDPRSRAYLLDY